ncbi:hypothetical protein [Labrys neptuniae]
MNINILFAMLLLMIAYNTGRAFMNEIEKEIYGKIAEFFTQRVADVYGGETFVQHSTNILIQAPYFYHISMSEYEYMADYLWRLGILRPLDERNGWAYHFKLTCPPDGAAEVALRNSSKGPSFARFLAFYLKYRRHHGRLNKPKISAFFSADEIYFWLEIDEIPLFELIAGVGHVTQADEHFIATEKVMPLLDHGGKPEDLDDPESPLL